MRIDYPGAARPQPWDRNPGLQVLNYNATGVAPHGTTVRASYTVPSGKKAFIYTFHAHLMRDSAPTTPARASLMLYVNGVVVVRVGLYSATVGDTAQEGLSLNLLASAGDLVQLMSEDTSVGGTMSYTASIIALEFDA